MTAPIFILAGEASGDVLASRIMRAVHQHYGQQQWIGLGGPFMAAEGLRSVADMSRLSLIGVGAAIQKYRQLSAFANELVDLVLQQRPKLILTVDAKGFSVRFAARLKRQMQRHGWSAPIIHTVAPTVWAWGKWRRHKFARAFDGLFCLFPFEPDYFVPLGLESHWVCQSVRPWIRNPAEVKIRADALNNIATDKMTECIDTTNTTTGSCV